MNEVRLAEEVRRARAGEPDAAEAVVRRTGRIALPLALAVVGNREDAADVAQDVALEVLRGLRRLRDPDRFDAWVRRIAVRRALGATRKRRRGGELSLSSELASSVAPDPHDGVHVLGLREALQAALAALPPRQRLALVLRYVGGLSEAEIADALGCRPGTAASLLSRARQLLRQNDVLAELAATPLPEVSR
jgi:RNA polymerase sigma factor (sigma-70 family)